MAEKMNFTTAINDYVRMQIYPDAMQEKLIDARIAFGEQSSPWPWWYNKPGQKCVSWACDSALVFVATNDSITGTVLNKWCVNSFRHDHETSKAYVMIDVPTLMPFIQFLSDTELRVKHKNQFTQMVSAEQYDELEALILLWQR